MRITKLEHQNRLLVYLSITLYSLCITDVHCQEDASSAIGSWMVFSMDNQLTGKWSVLLVGIICYENLAEQTEFGFIRTGLTYKTGPNLKLTLGTAYVDSQPLYHHEFETLTTQVWLYEQATLKTGALKHRMRLEHRWVNKPDENVFNTRLRYRFEFKQRLGPNYYVTCTDEPFLNFEGFKMDENRFFFGLGRNIGNDASIEIGYFKTHVRSNNFDRLRIAFHIKTQFFKNKLENITISNIDKFSK